VRVQVRTSCRLRDSLGIRTLEYTAKGKELRFNAADGVWRVAYAFDPTRKAILLVAGDKAGASEKQLYRGLIRKADARFDAHLARGGIYEGGNLESSRESR
jgi:hypothetical protein